MPGITPKGEDACVAMVGVKVARREKMAMVVAAEKAGMTVSAWARSNLRDVLLRDGGLVG